MCVCFCVSLYVCQTYFKGHSHYNTTLSRRPMRIGWTPPGATFGTSAVGKVPTGDVLFVINWKTIGKSWEKPWENHGNGG